MHHLRYDLSRISEGEIEKRRCTSKCSLLTLVTNMSPHGEMFRGQNVQLDHVRGVCMWLQAIYVGGFGSRSHQGSTHLDYFRSVTSLRERVRLSSTTPPSAVSDGAGSGSWRSWPGRASACWPGLPRMRTRRSSARLALCSSC